MNFLARILSERILIFLASLTLLGVGYFSYSYVDKSLQEQNRNYAEAMRIAEYGMQNALGQLFSDPLWRAGIPSAQQGNGLYTVTVRERTATSLELVSEGRINSSVHRIVCDVERNEAAGPGIFVLKSWKEE